MNPASPIPPLAVLTALLVGVGTAAVWFLLRRRDQPDNIALALLWVLGLAPITVTLLRPRLFAVDFTQPVAPGVWIRASQGFFLAAFALAVFGILYSMRRGSRAGAALVVAASVMYAGPVVSAALGGRGGLSETLLIAPVVVIAAYMTPQPPLDQLVRHARAIVRIYIYGSLASLAVAPVWATYRIALYDEQYLERAFFGIPQLTGMASDPNILGPLAAVALAIEVVRIGRRRFWIVHASAAFAVLFLSQSRTGYLAGAVSMIALIVWNFGRKPARLGVLVLTAALTLVPFIHPTPQTAVVQSLQSRDVSTLHGRTTVWRIALDEFERSPLIGYGPELFSPQYRRNLNAGLSWVGQGHNQYIQTLGESGLLGFVGLLAFLGGLTWTAFRATGSTKGLSAALILMFHVRCMTEVPLRNRGLDISLFEIYLLFVLLLVARPTPCETGMRGRPAVARVLRPLVAAGRP